MIVIIVRIEVIFGVVHSPDCRGRITPRNSGQNASYNLRGGGAVLQLVNKHFTVCLDKGV